MGLHEEISDQDGKSLGTGIMNNDVVIFDKIFIVIWWKGMYKLSIKSELDRIEDFEK